MEQGIWKIAVDGDYVLHQYRTEADAHYKMDRFAARKDTRPVADRLDIISPTGRIVRTILLNTI